MRIVDSLRLEEDPDGGAHVVDGDTFPAAHVNKAARIILEALRRPRTEQELAAILAEAAHCEVAEAAAPVAALSDDLRGYGWITS
ncbi:PqqD family peptide modification chaperone [Streptomyces sp. NBC_01275]|uniref:PqqD family peptide modification chaperone n=1 Tax=Streptomyces sp. NBC_01275 TaxID=2903807 RepID=UPI0022562806|nr:PqqD family peptide modification chaperone [Streptomyces sp. NBC_01275]MCX4766693.1 PqqD family peptide modification chaperone [Streptomyces sp. NBC_01275]